MGRWLKDQKERKKQEIRTHNAQLHAAVSVAGVAAAVAAVAASTASPDMPFLNSKNPPKSSAAIASAAALVASHCIEIAEDMGADHDQILTAVNSAINAKTSGDIMTLTAGAATGITTLFSIVFEIFCRSYYESLTCKREVVTKRNTVCSPERSCYSKSKAAKGDWRHNVSFSGGKV